MSKLKKIFLLLILFVGILYAKEVPTKMGCILAQQGEVSINWTVYGDELRAKESKSTQVRFIPIQKEGKNFHEILIGSTIEADFQNKPFSAKFIHIQSKKRISRGPRHGLVVLSLTLNKITKDIPMVYFYKEGDMQMKGHINLKAFKLSHKNIYIELALGLQIHSVVCAVPLKVIKKL